MISPADILAHITNGRTEAETARAISLSTTLAETEDMIREMMRAASPVIVEGGNTADLADLAEMRDMLDSADWPPTPLGLSEALKRADDADELDRGFAKALAETAAVRAERDALTAEVTDLRAQIADLTPRQWVRASEGTPQINRMIMVEPIAGAVYMMQAGPIHTPSWCRSWCYVPADLLTPPATP